MGDGSNDDKPAIEPIPEYDLRNLDQVLKTLDIRNHRGVQSYVEILLKHVISTYGHELNARWVLAIAALLRTQLAAIKEEREANEHRRAIEEKLGFLNKGWRMKGVV